MLKSLLFSLTLMLCLACASPLTRAAEEVRPEKTSSAESKTSTDALYKALLQRLDTIEDKLKTETRQAHDDEKIAWLFFFIAAGFIGLAGMAAGFAIAVTYNRRPRSLRQEQNEIVNKVCTQKKTLQEMLAEQSPSKKFAAPVLAQAQEAAAQGVGIEVLWAKAILAQEEERWQEALLYWQAVLETFPHDKTALFCASTAALQSSEKTEGEECQRLLQIADNYFRAFPEAQLTAAVLSSWGEIYQNRGDAASCGKERELLYDKAAEKYAKATKYAPQDITSWCNWGVLCQTRGTAAQEKDNQKFWYEEAEKNYCKAIEIDHKDAASWYNMACLASLRQDAATCIGFLKQWRACAPHASTADLDGEKDFDKVRDTPEFQALRKRLETGL